MGSSIGELESELAKLNIKEKSLIKETESLITQEARYSNIFENSAVAIWKEDFSEAYLKLDTLPCNSKSDYYTYLTNHPDLLRELIEKIKILDINNSTVTLLGGKNKDEIFASLDKLFIEESFNVFIGQFAAIATGDLYYECETVGRKLDGSPFHVLLTAYFPDKSGKTAFVTMMNITDRIEKEKQQQELLRETMEQKKIADMLVDITFALSSKTKQSEILDIILEQIENFMTYDSANIMLFREGKLSVLGHRGYDKFGAESFMEEFETEITSVGAIKNFLENSRVQVIKDTDTYPGWVKFPQTSYIKSALSIPIEWQENIIGLLNIDSVHRNHFSGQEAEKLKILCHGAAIFLSRASLFEQISMEIEKSKSTEKILRNSLKEKEDMLQEIHHRVKNNLTIIIALINLQSTKFTQSREIDLFEELSHRVHSIALVHEKLYENNDISSIDFHSYVHDLLDPIETVQIYKKNIKIKMEIPENIYFDMDILIPLGLILNELITNSLKYAFGNDGGEILIKIIEDNNKFILSVKDSGKGFPDSVLKGKESNLGLVLVKSLVEQIKGLLLLSNNCGAGITISFEIPEAKSGT